MDSNLALQLQSYIGAKTSYGLFASIEEAISLAYIEADKTAKSKLRYTPKARFRAQARRYFIDDAFKGAVKEGNVEIASTMPAGENYIVVTAGNITLSHIELHHNAIVRNAKHRKFLALKNAVLEPVQEDFFEEKPENLKEALHVVVVTTHPNTKAANQSAPDAIHIGIPYSDWSDFHMLIPLKEFLGVFENGFKEILQHPDQAWPSIKAGLLKNERQSNN